MLRQRVILASNASGFEVVDQHIERVGAFGMFYELLHSEIVTNFCLYRAGRGPN